MKASLLPKTWNIPQIFRERLGDSAGKQRLMDEEGHLLLILHKVPKANDDSERQAAFFWLSDVGEWKSIPAGGGLAALTEHLNEYEVLITELDDKVEKAKSARDYFSILHDATPVLRATRHMMGVLQQARDARKSDRKILLLRDRAVELERGIDLLTADAKAGMEFITAEAAAEQAEIAHQATMEARRLNILAAFFFASSAESVGKKSSDS